MKYPSIWFLLFVGLIGGVIGGFLGTIGVSIVGIVLICGLLGTVLGLLYRKFSDY